MQQCKESCNTSVLHSYKSPSSIIFLINTVSYIIMYLVDIYRHQNTGISFGSWLDIHSEQLHQTNPICLSCDLSIDHLAMAMSINNQHQFTTSNNFLLSILLGDCSIRAYYEYTLNSYVPLKHIQ